MFPHTLLHFFLKKLLANLQTNCHKCTTKVVTCKAQQHNGQSLHKIIITWAACNDISIRRHHIELGKKTSLKIPLLVKRNIWCGEERLKFGRAGDCGILLVLR